MQNLREKILSPPPEYDPCDGIVIFGEPRSGTTWLAEMLAWIEGSIINWEPLHPSRGVVPKSFKWGDRPYIPENVKNIKSYELMRDILCLRLGNDWTKLLAPNGKLEEGSTIITKMVRGNMLVPWFLKNFDMVRKPILILRHPLDTCISQIRNFDRRFNDVYTVPDCINNDRFLEQRELIQHLDSRLERQIALWCLNNMPTIEHPGIHNKLTIMFYENLISDPRREMAKTFEGLGVGDVPDNLEDFMDFRKPSSSDFKDTYLAEPDRQLEKNFRGLDNGTAQKIQTIFDYFGFGLYNMESPYPIKAPIEHIGDSG